MKITAKDFFIQVGAIAAFYASAVALITLLFEVINFAYPKITNAYYYYSPSISLQVATLIVAFPLFLLLSWLLQRSYAVDPSLREAGLRKWLSYITLFVAGLVVTIDLITVIYMFLDGQELTKGFLLKVLVLLVVAGGIFLYYLREIRNVIASSERNIWRVVAVLLILLSIGIGFSVIGSPAAQRAYRYDNQRVTDLQNLQWQVLNYWQQKSTVPTKLSDLDDSLKGGYAFTDPQTGQPYEYAKTGNLSFNLCTTFSRETRLGKRPIDGSVTRPIMSGGYMGPEGENWEHQAGRHCFERTIDPELYPPYPKTVPVR
ncbi:hypothetical protein KW785_00780 [Candidatus Parcubacteria bacterium]|nr:hypothetical protein [Candidatus Parcubacteria bacterium]